MAVTHVKVTYSVQPETASRVQELATKWGVPKSEVIRQAVDGASRQELVTPRLTPLQALEELRLSACLTPTAARRFAREVRLSRTASSRKREEQQSRAWKKYKKASDARRRPA